ncbi:LysR family transcriptional regulator [Glaciecola sp. MH2013]|uniref:LysR family transcriptional regulator n=1 Tax=Glaciecola sp. MH2013 TaxID=2785524 RepID=UPI00189CC68D|nr:LysR family transcriptional regulator [Glaciecola sp. MH2013]MBF7073042.1 LysR family transcriptional regulator [Glaciecola sp. MH2013]
MAKADDIVLFVQVVDEGSFSKVAERLNLTNSVVSKRIGRLEASLNVQLLYRTTRKLNLTDAGRTLYGKARLAKLAIQDAENAVTGYANEMRGNIRITMPVVSANLLLSAAVAEFCKQYPDIHVELQINNRFVDLIGEGYDLAIRTAYLEDSSLIARRLIDSQWVFCASPAYLQEKGIPREPTDLVEHECLIYKFESAGSDIWPINVEGENSQLQIHGRFHTNNLNAIRHAALSDLGIGFLPKALVHDDLGDEKLIEILQGFAGKRMGMYAVYPKSRQPDQKLKLLVAHLRDALHNKQEHYC